MKVRSLVFVAVVLLLAVPGLAVAKGEAEVRIDLFQAVDTLSMVMADPCGGTIVADADGRGFQYLEGEDPAAQTDVDLRGYADSGCGFARLRLQIPEGAESLHASFFADRDIETIGPDQGRRSRQGLRLTDLDTGARVYDVDVFAAEDGSREERRHDRGAIPLAPGLRNASLEFYFEDVPPLEDETGSLAGSPLSGRRFSAYVHDIELLVHGDLASPPQVSSSAQREGTILLDELQVRMDVPRQVSAFRSVLRILVDSSFDFERLRLPDGSTIGEARTWNGSLAGPAAVLVERTDEGLEITLNPALVALGGPGEYVVVARSAQNVRVSPVLLPVAVLLLATPLPFAVLAIVQARGFYREAFGAYRLAARNLMLGVVGVFVYYVAVLASAFVAGRLDLMGVWPLPFEGVLLYLQVLAAAVAFVLLWSAARALYWITRPRPGTVRDSKDS